MNVEIVMAEMYYIIAFYGPITPIELHKTIELRTRRSVPLGVVFGTFQLMPNHGYPVELRDGAYQLKDQAK